jgi:hypothetical protein
MYEGGELNCYNSWVSETLGNAFLPLSCECTFWVDGTLNITIFDKASGRVDLTVVGITLDRIRTVREVAVLIAEIREELQTVGHDLSRVSVSDASV